MRLYVPLNRQEYEALEKLAYAERRRPQEQAAVILAQTLARDFPQTATDPDQAPKTTTPRPCEEAERASA